MPAFDIATPVSSPASSTYATVDDVIARYDVDQIKRLVTDGRTDISMADLRQHPNFLVSLQSAAGRIEAALLHGGRYSVEDLDGLTGNSASYLADLNAEIAFELLLRRRMKAADERNESEKRVTNSLNLLSSGKDVLAIATHVDAGLLEHKAFDQISTVLTRNLRTDQLKGRLFAQD